MGVAGKGLPHPTTPARDRAASEQVGQPQPEALDIFLDMGTG